MSIIPEIKPYNHDKYTCHQSKYPIASDLPTRALIVAPSNNCKSALLQNIILNFYRGCFEKRIIISTSIFIDNVWKPVLDYCEKELKQCEDIIKSYEETIRLFRDGLYRLNMDITINSSDALFIEHINHAFYENLKQRNIIGKLKQYQVLRAELVHLQTIAMIVANHARVPRNVVTAGVSRNNTNSEVSEGAAASATSSSLNQLVSGTGSGTTVGFSTRIMDDEDDSPRFGAGSFPNCRICLMNEADNVLVPCGHIACKQCMSNLQSNNRCFFCRTPSTRIVQMYSN
jgi:hypothetical protein